MNMPGFNAEASLRRTMIAYNSSCTSVESTGSNNVTPQAFVPIPSPFKVSWNVYCSEGTCFIVDQFGNKHYISFSNV